MQKVEVYLGFILVKLEILFSVLKQPAAIVASYSMLLLGALSCFGPNREYSYLPLPKWRRKAPRPSCQDMVNLLRKELTENKKCVSELDVDIDPIISLISLFSILNIFRTSSPVWESKFPVDSSASKTEGLINERTIATR